MGKSGEKGRLEKYKEISEKDTVELEETIWVKKRGQQM